MKPLFRLLIPAVLLLSLIGPVQAAASEGSNATPEGAKSLLSAQSDFLEEQKSKLDQIESRLPEQTSRLRQELKSLTPDISKLIRLKSFFRSSFREMLLLTQNIEHLEKSLRGRLQPLKSLQQELEALQKRLTRQREELKEQFQYAPFVQNLEYNLQRLEEIDALKERAVELETKIEQARKPADEYLTKLHQFRTDLEGEVIRSWKDYYLTRITPLYTIDFSDWTDELSSWKKSLPIFVRYFLIGQIQWPSYLAHLGMFVPIFFGLCLIPVLKLSRSSLGLDRGRLVSVALIFSLGLAMILAYALFQGFSASILLRTLWRLLLSLSLVLFLPMLRFSLIKEQPAGRSPLVFLWALFSLCIGLQNLVFSGLIQHAGSLVLFGGGLIWLSKRPRPKFNRILERNIIIVTPVFLTVGLILSLAGWMHIAYVLVTSWFVLCIGLYLGSVTALLLKRRIDAIPDHGWGYVWQGVSRGIGVPLLWLLSLSLVVLWLGASLGDMQFLEQLSQLKIGWGKVSINVFRLLMVVLGGYLTYSFLTIIKSVLASASEKKEQIDAGTATSLRALITYVVWSIFIIAALAFIGFDLTSLTVVAGGLSVGIGFGLQSIVSNFISGLILLFGRSIRPGDIIQIGDMWAEVKEINIRTTEIETFDKSSILMPNSKLISEEITNWTYRDKVLRRKVTVHVTYGSDVQLVKRLLLYIADTHPDVLGIPAPFIRFSDFGDGSLQFTLYFYASMDVAWMTESELRFEIDKLFKEYGLDFAIPLRKLSFAQGPAEPNSPAESESGS